MSHAQDFRAFIRQNGAAPGGSNLPDGYSGSPRQHYGLSAPVMHGFVRDWTKTHKAALTFEAWVQTLDALYHGDSIEERIFAGLLLAQFAAFRQMLPLAQLHAWLGELEGWAEIDTTCQSTFTAKEMLAKWDEWQPFFRELSQDARINRRRASLVLMVKPLRETNDTRLLDIALENVERLKGEKDKLITKAVSWVLREATRQHAAAVQAYLDANAATLPKIAVREVQSKLCFAACLSQCPQTCPARCS